MNHQYRFEVRGYELDSFNHVNNSVYLNYLEEARWKFLEDAQWLDYMKNQLLYAVVVEIKIRYIKELRVFDEAVVKSRWHHDGEYLIADQYICLADTNKRIARATVKMILVSFERVVHEIPDFIKKQLNKQETV